LGFLFSYAALVTHESDFRIVEETRLIPEDLQWAAWRIAVVQLLAVSSTTMSTDISTSFGRHRSTATCLTGTSTARSSTITSCCWSARRSTWVSS
ncbi:hypothetical protein LY76DRAFT_528854, partial [Colletotrichum caudatum]